MIDTLLKFVFWCLICKQKGVIKRIGVTIVSSGIPVTRQLDI